MRRPGDGSEILVLMGRAVLAAIRRYQGRTFVCSCGGVDPPDRAFGASGRFTAELDGGRGRRCFAGAGRGTTSASRVGDFGHGVRDEGRELGVCGGGFVSRECCRCGWSRLVKVTSLHRLQVVAAGVQSLCYISGHGPFRAAEITWFDLNFY